MGAETRRIWLSCPYHRRSDLLSRAFRCRYHHFGNVTEPKLVRYASGFIGSFITLLKERPRIVFVQNPSLALAVHVVLMKPVFRYRLINDLHTPYIRLREPLRSIFWGLQRFCIRFADLTIVTNESFARELDRPAIMVLPDKLPVVSVSGTRRLEGSATVLYVCTFADDEPYTEVIASARALPADTHVYITGNYRKRGIDPAGVPRNVHLTGFIPDNEYFELMSSVDAVMVLTSQENCLVCGGYEGLAAGKPLILSNTVAMRLFFSKGAVYIDHDAASIAAGISKAIESRDRLRAELLGLGREIESDWLQKSAAIENVIQQYER